MSTAACHAFISVPDIDMQDVEKLKVLNFDSWADFHHTMRRETKNSEGNVTFAPLPMDVARGIQDIISGFDEVCDHYSQWALGFD